MIPYSAIKLLLERTSPEPIQVKFIILFFFLFLFYLHNRFLDCNTHMHLIHYVKHRDMDRPEKKKLDYLFHGLNLTIKLPFEKNTIVEMYAKRLI